MLIQEIGKIIKERRKTLGITQAHLAELAEVNVNTVIRIENGKINPTIEVLHKITEVLGLEFSLGIKESKL